MSYWYSIITRASCWASIWAVTQERRLTRPAVLFNHVPSTGGSTWEVLWSRYACASNLTACPYSEAVGRTISADRPASGTPYCKPSDDVVASHMTPAGFRALRAARAAYLPQNKYLTVTMVREPCGATLARFLHPQHAHHSIVPRLCEVDAFKSTYERPHAREDVDKKKHTGPLCCSWGPKRDNRVRGGAGRVDWRNRERGSRCQVPLRPNNIPLWRSAQVRGCCK